MVATFQWSRLTQKPVLSCGLAWGRGWGEALQLSYDMEGDQNTHQLLIHKDSFKSSHWRGAQTREVVTLTIWKPGVSLEFITLLALALGDGVGTEIHR